MKGKTLFIACFIISAFFFSLYPIWHHGWFVAWPDEVVDESHIEITYMTPFQTAVLVILAILCVLVASFIVAGIVWALRYD